MNADVGLSDLGMVCALGGNRETIWADLFEDPNSGLSPYEGIHDWSPVPTGRVRARLPEVPERLSELDCRNNRLAMAALQPMREAVRETREDAGPARVGTVVGTSTSGVAAAESAIEEWLEVGSLPNDFDYRQMEMGGLAAFMREFLRLEGPSYTISTSCSSSAKVFASARSLLVRDLCDAVVVGGADSLCGLTLNGFHALQLVSDEPCNPMSRHRDGLNIGEGAAFFLMTREPSPVVLEGVGESSDAHSMNAPDPEGHGAEAAMQHALRDAGLDPKDLNYLNLHGTATPQNDAMESRAVDRLFDDVPCSSTKPFTGHLLGAAGAVETGFCWLALQHHQAERGLPLPPHRWDGERDASLPTLNLVEENHYENTTGTPAVMSSSFAFGGHNCSLVLSEGSTDA